MWNWRFSAALAACLLAGGPAAPQGRSLEPPFAVDCSAETERGEVDERATPERPRAGGVRVLADRRYGEGEGYGYEGGEGFRSWFAGIAGIWGTRQPDLFASGRRDPGTYRFDLPAGEYIVALGFAEIEEHRAGRRIFDIRVQGNVVARGFDPFATAGYAQAIRLVYPARVGGEGRLTIDLQRAPESPRPPFINAIWIHPRRDRRDEAGPRPPPSFRGSGSYRMNVLFWEHPDDERIAGTFIERRCRGEPFTALTPTPVPVARWIDADVDPGVEYEYRVASASVDGRRGPASDPVRLVPRAPESSSLPVYSVEASQEGLEQLLTAVDEERWIVGAFRFQGEDHPIRLRLRGASSRNAAKLGYRLDFRSLGPFGARRRIYLRAEPADHTLQQEKLTCDVFRSLGLPVSEARYVNFFINGRYQGVYLDLEPIDDPLIRRLGFTGSDLLRSSSFQGLESGRSAKKVFGGRQPIEELVQRVNRLERGEFESFARAALDWPRVRDYLAASVICHRSEIEANDFYYFRDRGSSRWLLIPWDHNNGNFGVPACGLEVGRPFMPLLGQTLQALGPRRDYWYVLPSRLFQHESLRREYLDRVEEIARELLLSDRIDRLIEENFAALRPELLADPFRWPPGRDEPFLRSGRELESFARRHGERLLRLIEEERRRGEPPVVIEEFSIGAEGGWVELRNRSGEAVSLERCFLGSLRPLRPWRRFAAADRLTPGELRVFEIAPGGAELEPEERERLERRLDDREDDRRAGGGGGRGSAPSEIPWRIGLPDPQGGTLALFGPRDRVAAAPLERERDGEDPLEVIDWFSFGPRAPGFSYGRLDGGFAFLEPTPGKPNAGPAVLPPPLLADTTGRLRVGFPLNLSARIEEIVPAAPPARITLRYAFGDSGAEWLEAPMEIEAGETRPAQARVSLPPPAGRASIRYYFIAWTAGGLERRSPLTAPEGTFARWIGRPGD